MSGFRTETLAEGVEIRLADCVEALADVRADAVITSPPYDDLRQYGGHSFDWRKVIQPIRNAVGAGSVLVWNVADSVVDGSETGNAFRQAHK